MDTFLQRHKLPKHSQQEINNMSSSVLVKPIESVDKYISSLPSLKDTPDSDSFTGETKQLRKKLYQCPQVLLEN